VAQTLPGSLAISWPASFTGFVLLGNDVLPGSVWTPVSGVVNNSVTVELNGAARFYRLAK
jgi:hypothetical protein